MSAFGRKNGLGGKSSFGVARPMHAPGASPHAGAPAPAGGVQFPPLPAEPPAPVTGPTPPLDRNADAMARLTERMNTDHSSSGDSAQGFLFSRPEHPDVVDQFVLAPSR